MPNERSTFWYLKRGKVWLSTFGVTIVLAIIAGVLIYREGVRKSDLKSQAEELTRADSTQQNISPTIAEIPDEAAISEYQIMILNGSGIRGEAARVRDLLEKEGFNVISIGNSKQADYIKTVIQVKKDTSRMFVAMLKSSLEKTYTLDDVAELSENEEVDVVVTIGKIKALIEE